MTTEQKKQFEDTYGFSPSDHEEDRDSFAYQFLKNTDKTDPEHSCDGQGDTFHAGQKDCPVPTFDYQIERANEMARLDLEAERQRNEKGTMTLTKIFDYMEMPETKDAPGQQVIGEPVTIDCDAILEGLTPDEKHQVGIIIASGMGTYNDIPKNYQIVFSELLRQKHAEMGLLTADEVYGMPMQSIQEINHKTILGETYFTKCEGVE